MPFAYSRRAERIYCSDILGVVRRYFEQGFSFAHKLTTPEWLYAYAKQAAERMVTGQAVENARSWREAALKSSQGPLIYRELYRELRNTKVGERYRELIASNAQYITSLPQKIAQQVVRTVAREHLEGERAETISRLLAHTTKSHAMLLARTESAKASAALTQARAEYLGLNWYVWQTSEDQRVRRSHRKMRGVLINFFDPPSPEMLFGERSYGKYNAGNIFNCRCYAEPLLKLSQIQWPHKVYMRGVIRYMTLSEFRRTDNIIAATAA